MAKELLGAYAEPDLVKRVEKECATAMPGTVVPKSQMMIVLLTEALDARDASRGKKK